jgi:hypothetical protein
MLREFVRRGPRSQGEGMWFRSLQYRYPEEYRHLMEVKYQRRLL